MQQPDLREDELAHRGARIEVERAGIEFRERAREHDLREHRVRPHEDAKELREVDKVHPGVARVRDEVGVVLAAQHAEALEEDLPHETGLVAEEFVDGGSGCVRFAGDFARREGGHAVAREHHEGGAKDVVAEFARALLSSRHGADDTRRAVAHRLAAGRPGGGRSTQLMMTADLSPSLPRRAVYASAEFASVYRFVTTRSRSGRRGIRRAAFAYRWKGAFCVPKMRTSS